MAPTSVPPEAFQYLANKTVLVTGAAGSVGAGLTEQIARFSAARAVRAFDHNESGLFHLFERMRGVGKVTPLLGDVRDLERLRLACQGVDVLFHAAALKHVELGEYNPFEVVGTNLVGVNNVIRAALDNDVERVIFTSSDKAVNPTNVMGASKMMGERLIVAANDLRGPRRARFACVRFGNVLGSSGSVVPVFAEAARRGESLRLTHPEMTRYVMTLGEAARLVLEAGGLMRGGEIFVTKMRAIAIADLARVVVEEVRGRSRSEITASKPRMGEKLYEELITRDELARAHESERMIIVLPHWEGLAGTPPLPSEYDVPLRPVDRLWNSAEETCMPLEDLRAYLRKHDVLAPWVQA